MRIEPLARFHDRKSFDCGYPILNRYLRHTARQHSDKGISRTFVCAHENQPEIIIGFYTLSSCEVLVQKLPNQYARKYPSRAPVAKLARLAVAKKFQRLGIGTRLMVDAMNKVLQVADFIGIIGFFVDAKDEAAAAFYRQFGFIPLPDNPLEFFLPLATIRKAFGR